MPFGLHNAAQTFQRFMDQVVRGISSVYAYIDDVLIASSTPQQHLIDLSELFSIVSPPTGLLSIQTSASLVFPLRIFLDMDNIDCHGITTLPDKVHAIRYFPLPHSQVVSLVW